MPVFAEHEKTVQKKEPEKTAASPNKTGIPDGVKTRFENLSGFSFDDVRVHYNSSKPAHLSALAYTQGNEVHIAPGQERHLNHELGHVVQQKQGIVKPNASIGGKPVNTTSSLERAADRLGGMTVQRMELDAAEGIDVIQRQGRGNHLYNDFIAHFIKSWVPVLEEIISILDTFPKQKKVAIKSSKELLNGIMALLGEATNLSEMREYDRTGKPLYDGEDLSGKEMDENEIRYGSIMQYLDLMMVSLLNALRIGIYNVSTTDYFELLISIKHLSDNIGFYMIDHKIKIKTNDTQILVIFRSILTLTHEILGEYSSLIQMYGSQSISFKSKIIEDIKERTKISIATPEIIEQAKREHTSAPPIIPPPLEAEAIPDGPWSEMLESRDSVLLGLLKLQGEQQPTDRIEIDEHGTFQMNPDEISGAHNDCFFNTLIALGVADGNSVEDLRVIAGTREGEMAERNQITALAMALNLTIFFTQFDLSFAPGRTIRIGAGGRIIHIAQIFGGHFTPLRKL